MAKEHDKGESPQDPPSTVTPSSALEETLEQHLDIYPGQAAASGHEGHEASEFSRWPIIVAFSVMVIGAGLLSHYLVSVVGAVVLMAAIVGWFTERWVS